jgi:hypothetical protein
VLVVFVFFRFFPFFVKQGGIVAFPFCGFFVICFAWGTRKNSRSFKIMEFVRFFLLYEIEHFP